MWIQFQALADHSLDADLLRRRFSPVADAFDMSWQLTDAASR
jgi:hypothetical protein